MARPTIDGVVHHGYPWDLSWTGPWWVQHVTLPQVTPWIVLPAALFLLGAVYFVANALWDRMETGSIKAIAWRNVRRNTG